MELQKPKFTGGRVTRLEDARLLSGQARYLDDIEIPGMLEIAFVRSNRAAAKILSIDTSEALALPGVKAVFTAENIPIQMGVGYDIIQCPLAKDEVRFVGELVAAVVADNRYIAEDAAELVKVEYEPLPAVVNMEVARKEDCRRVHEHRPNLFFHNEMVTEGFDEVFASAPHRAEASFRTYRQTGVPMETRGCAASIDAYSGRLTVYVSHQSPHNFRSSLCKVMGLSENMVRIVVPEVGGAFGIKAMFYPEYVVVSYIAMQLKRAVKWISDRTECLLSDAHARENLLDVEVAYDDDGRVLAIRNKVLADTGAYPILGFAGAVGEAGWATNMLTGPYKIEHLAIRIDCVFSNKAPVGAYRGVGGPVGAQVQEGIMELVARKLGKDPADVRRVNIIQPEDFPYRTPTGNTYDPGSYKESMETALQLIDYEGFQQEQIELRKQGRYVGIGMCVFVEPSAFSESEAGSIPYETATIRMETNGTVTAALGLGPSGQGHETTMAQLIADQIGIDVKDIVVLHGDTDSAPFGGGTGGSRSGTIGGGAAIGAARELRKRLAKLSAHLLEASEEDIELKDGRAQVAGVPASGIPIAELARIAYTDIKRVPEEMQLEPGLEVSFRFRPPMNKTFSNGTHVTKVEVDVNTGFVQVLDYVAVNDCGNLINPMIVEGQIHGGIAQGVGSGLLEELIYDEDGQLTTLSFADYLLPTSMDVPRIRVAHIITPSESEGGFKGLAEGSLIGAPSAIINAVSDALEPFGVFLTDIPIRPAQLLESLSKASAGR